MLHLGCGRNNRPGWVNIDLCSDGPDLQLDLRETLPFDDGSVVLIYNEHFFEHIPYPNDVKKLLASFLRVLEPGGVLSMSMPDAERGLRDYVEEGGKRLRAEHPSWLPSWCDTPMHQVNYLFRQMGEHQYAWDFESLSKVLQNAGFTNVERRAWDASLDSEAWKGPGTLCVKAVKPGGASK
jgi:predicted SAM-dependent methyltransferase